MTAYAVVHTGGKQYRVQPGDIIDVELLDAHAGASIDLSDVRMISSEAGLLLGTPTVAGARVVAQVQEEQHKGPKLVVFKYKAKKHYRKKTGHRQRYTRLLVSEIVANDTVLAKFEPRPRAPRAPAEEAKVQEQEQAPTESSPAPAVQEAKSDGT